MKARVRRVLAYAVALFVVGVGVALWSLRAGRPLFYTDGEQQVAATELANASMLLWETPVPELELPGPVRGRAQELPDGRVLYGRGLTPLRTDLVLVDPARPDVEPEAAFGLNSSGHDLAPALGADGWVYFCSDRRGGQGGFDLYRARWRNGSFGGVEPLPIGVNTGEDECDPAPDPRGDQLLFVRRDPDVAAGRNGMIWRGDVLGAAAPEPLWELKRGEVRLERDPAWSPDGVGLWFVREGEAGPSVMRTWRLGEQFAPPVAQAALNATGPFRAPEPLGDGYSLRLLRTTPEPEADPEAIDDGAVAVVAPPALVYRSSARELYPWWEGQAWLEFLLFCALVIGLVVLLLLLLGSYWRQLDVVTWCLLVSLFLHLLLMVLLTDVEIVRRFFPTARDEGGLEVQLVSGAQQSAGSGLEVEQDAANPFAEVRFGGHTQELEAAAPAAAVADAAPRPAADGGEAELAELTPTEREVEVEVADAAEAAPTRQGEDVRPELESQEAPGTAAEVAPLLAQPAPRDDATAAPEAPSVAPTNAPADRADRADRVAAATPDAPQAQAREVVEPVLGDRAEIAPTRSVRDETTGAVGLATDVAQGPAATPQEPRAAARAAAAPATAPGATLSADQVAQLSSRGGRREPERAAPTQRAEGARVANPAALRDAATTGEAPRAAVDPRAAAPTAAAAGPGVEVTPSQVALRAARVAAQGSAAEGDELAPPTAAPAKGGGGRLPAALAAAALPQPTRGAAPSPTLADAPAEPQRAAAGSPDATARGVQRPAPADVGSVAQSAPAAQVATPTRRTPGRGRQAIRLAPPSALMGRVASARRAQSSAPLVTAARPRGPRPGSALRDAVEVSTGATAATPREERGAAPRPTASAARPRAASTALARPTRRSATGDRTPPGARSLPVPTTDLGRAQRHAAGPLAAAASLPRSARTTNSGEPDVELRDRPSSTNGGTERRAGTPPSTQRSSGVDAAAPLAMGAVADLRMKPRFAERVRPSAQQPEAQASGGLRPPTSLLRRAPRAESEVAVSTRELPTAKVVPELYTNRFGPNKVAALERFGGSVETERAVRLGLAYLARVQNRDGSWGDRGWWDDKYGEVTVGKTALCLLAFLGAGHAPSSRTEHSAVAARAVQFLLSVQDPDSGAFGRTSSYGHGISTYALAECLAMSPGETRLREPVQSGVDWILANQSRSRDPRNRGGWGYFSDTLAPEDRYSRNSITAWMVMALESAMLSKVPVPGRARQEARRFLLNAWSEDDGWFYYNQNRARLVSDWPTLPASTPASVFALRLLGHPANDWRLRAALDYTLDRRPRRYERPTDDAFVLQAAGHVYFWYYGSLACFMAGGETWDVWNRALKDVLPEAQERDGSWRQIGPYARIARDHNGDRSYTTAMCVLSLEVYYRYFTPLLENR